MSYDSFCYDVVCLWVYCFCLVSVCVLFVVYCVAWSAFFVCGCLRVCVRVMLCVCECGVR